MWSEQFWSIFRTMPDELPEQNRARMVSPDGHPNMCSWLGSHVRSWGLDRDNFDGSQLRIFIELQENLQEQ
jgi:hypothetical protein